MSICCVSVYFFWEIIMRKNILITLVLLFLFTASAYASLDYTFFLDKVISGPYKFYKNADNAHILINTETMFQDEDLKAMMLEIAPTILLLDSRQTIQYVIIECAAAKDDSKKSAKLNTEDLLNRFKGDISLAELLSRIEITQGGSSAALNRTVQGTADLSGSAESLELPVDEENIQKIKERQALQTKAMSLLQQGQAANASGYYAQAAQYLKEALSINANLHECYYELGLAYYGVKDYDNAVSYAKKYLNFKPSEKKGYMLLGQVYSVKADWQKAFTAYKNAAVLTDELSQYVTGVGNVTGAQVTALENHIKGNSGDIAAKVKLALCCEAKGEFKKGVMVWQGLLGE